mmetsp:Transcript_8955/g.21530  ORF Transcript_8955/g.21530 Transcript_8955/m.21530 type:complete len:209 (-) Transcript_8955:1320-1946(-)
MALAVEAELHTPAGAPGLAAGALAAGALEAVLANAANASCSSTFARSATLERPLPFSAGLGASDGAAGVTSELSNKLQLGKSFALSAWKGSSSEPDAAAPGGGWALVCPPPSAGGSELTETGGAGAEASNQSDDAQSAKPEVSWSTSEGEGLTSEGSDQLAVGSKGGASNGWPGALAEGKGVNGGAAAGGGSSSSSEMSMCTASAPAG